MRAEHSPHRHADAISTPMLVIHGDRDYRVPIGEALRLWWDLVSRHAGPPETLPHRFLYFPDENHWVLRPSHARSGTPRCSPSSTTTCAGGRGGQPELLS